MKLISTAIPLAALFSTASAVNVRHGGHFDHRLNAPFKAACFSSLISPLHGRFDFGSVPSWPYIGGADAVEVTGIGCGSCWHISYEGKSINITTVDTAKDGFKLSRKAMDALTNDKHAVLEASATKIDKGYCGL